MKLPCAVLLWSLSSLAAGEVRSEFAAVQIVDPDGVAVPGAAVYLDGAAAGSPGISTGAPPAQVDVEQVNKEFVPRVTVVQTGTRVRFPNHDDVSHHVYSFSQPNDFELPLYRETSPSVVFNAPGLITLGCNIHDSMVGYILVVDTPDFAVTDDQGIARLDGIASFGDTRRLWVWSPELSDGERLEAYPAGWRDLDAQVASGAPVRFMITRQVVRVPDATDGSLSWDDY